ncbi:hypothetical protein ES708_25996 [subsurface metagenome]
MARIKLGPVVTDIAGSIGCMTIQRNRYGLTMRAKPLPIIHFTASQYIVRRNIVTIQKAWQALSDAKRLQWSRFLDYSGQSIKHDKNVKLSGHLLYLKYQMYRLLAGFPLLVDLAYIPPPTPRAVVGFTVEGIVMQLEIDLEVNDAQEFFLFSISNPRTQAQAISRQGIRHMFITPSTGTVFNIADSYINAFGVLPSAPSWCHYSILTFSVLAPVYTGVTLGKYIVEL